MADVDAPFSAVDSSRYWHLDWISCCLLTTYVFLKWWSPANLFVGKSTMTRYPWLSKHHGH